MNITIKRLNKNMTKETYTNYNLLVSSLSGKENNLISYQFIDSSDFVTLGTKKKYQFLIPQDEVDISIEFISDKFIGLDIYLKICLRDDYSESKVKHKRIANVPMSEKKNVCGCGKAYLSYPALYNHKVLQHNGETQIGSYFPRSNNGELRLVGRPTQQTV